MGRPLQIDSAIRKHQQRRIRKNRKSKLLLQDFKIGQGSTVRSPSLADAPANLQYKQFQIGTKIADVRM